MIDNSSRWIKGSNFKLDNGKELKNLSIDFIGERIEESYQLFIRTFCQNTEDMAVILYQMGLDYEEVTDYQLFTNLLISYYFHEDNFNEDFKGENTNTSFFKIVNEYLILDGHLVVFNNEVGEVLFMDSNTKKIVITEKIYKNIKEITKKVTGFTNVKLEKTQNEGTKMAYLDSLLEDMEIAQENNTSGRRYSFSSYITAIVLETSYDYETVFNINMFQFHTILGMIKKREEWGNVMIGVYTGNIDSKNNKLNESHWLLT